jgi:hypothetical protein
MDNITVSRKVYDDLQVDNFTNKYLLNAAFYHEESINKELFYAKSLTVILSVSIVVTIGMILLRK